MTTLNQAEAVFSQLEKQLKDHPLFTGIEIAALRKDGTYTDDLCVRVLVNSPSATHETLNLPKEIDGVVIEVHYSVIELH
ncbi:MAG: hypothetical protein LZF64_01270 [Nitrosomonas sp.]|uniref:hypothetical protein n=1 Tax=Nitrosomonas sp. TaxID=42353 RepID=UPI001A5B5104|nr:hypothetical protein [Nitrosomonas sp.]MBL8500452.1 hypothetical protein [Nitrosomonas sp.]MCG7755660.1 hypothetical protein [Nitrosomonas sp.]UJP00445.1 MAG: hypothetical protein LZF64_01270 [Nitrosomonas sp.]UJP02906.1 MAG: hypothetical protein LZF85_00115 [Nitrosomonas sp.]UJP07416.1 MAG: hypothetical protein LZF84_10355 [Nitrosomonas sp.]